MNWWSNLYIVCYNVCLRVQAHVIWCKSTGSLCTRMCYALRLLWQLRIHLVFLTDNLQYYVQALSVSIHLMVLSSACLLLHLWFVESLRSKLQRHVAASVAEIEQQLLHQQDIPPTAAADIGHQSRKEGGYVYSYNHHRSLSVNNRVFHSSQQICHSSIYIILLNTNNVIMIIWSTLIWYIAG